MKCVQTIIGLAITLSIVSLKNVEGRRSFRTGISESIVTDDKNEHSFMCPTTINGCRQKCLHNPCFFQDQPENQVRKTKKYSALTLVPSSVHFERKPPVTKCKCICESVEADGTPFGEAFRPVTNPIPYQCSEEQSYKGNPMKFFERPRGETRKGEEDMVLPKKYCKNILPREGEDLMQWKGDSYMDKFNTPWRVRYPVDKKTILCTDHILNPSFNLMMEERKGFLDSIPRTSPEVFYRMVDEKNDLEDRMDKLKEELNNPKTLYGKDVLVEELQLLKKRLAGIEDVLYTSRQVE